MDYKNIQFKSLKPADLTPAQGTFYGLTYMECNWGNIGFSTEVFNEKDLESKFGTYFDRNKNDYYQCLSFLKYAPYLYVVRVAPKTTTPTFVANYLSTVTGVSHSHLFFSNLTTKSIDVWNSVNNGGSLYLKNSDFDRARNVPTFASTQIISFIAKYAGEYGNNIGISVANYLDDLSQKYIYKALELTVSNGSLFAVGNMVSGDTSAASGKILYINGNILGVDLYHGTFTTETINSSTDTITSIVSSDDIDYNITFEDLFDRCLQVNEFAVVITLGNEIKDYQILSVNPLKDNYCETYESDLITMFLNPSITVCGNYDSSATKQANIMISSSNEKLLKGFNTLTSISDSMLWLDVLKDESSTPFEIFFKDIEAANFGALCSKLNEVNNIRDDILFCINKI